MKINDEIANAFKKRGKESKTGKSFLYLRSCGICEWPIGYVTDGENVGFSGSCGCVEGITISNLTWEDFAQRVSRSPKLLEELGIKD